ncbi:MAG: cyclic nucleotide-binding domain-containing protein [Dehalococcoidia bacterium]|nr:cyclic nucleotide-binding domain-containing protein [Dehalococcoidia bacterium]
MIKTAGQVSIQHLRGVDIFAGLYDDDLARIGQFCSERTYEAGEYCATQGETTDELHIINAGKVIIEKRLEVTPLNQRVNITTLSQGKVCAWSAVVEPHILTASIRCLDRTQMISIKASTLQRIFRERPMVGYVVMKNLAGVISTRLRDSHIQLVSLIAEIIKQAS